MGGRERPHAEAPQVRNVPVGQRRGTKSVFYEAMRSKKTGAARVAATEELLRDSDSSRGVARNARVQVRLRRGTKDVELRDLPYIRIDSLHEVRRPAAWARRYSPSGLFVVDRQHPDDPKYQVWHESNLERLHMLEAAWDQSLGDFVSQPMALSWTFDDVAILHVPDLLIERPEGAPLLVDCRPSQHHSHTDFQHKVHLTALTAQEIGFEYEVWSEVAPQRSWNLEHLSLFNETVTGVSLAAAEVSALAPGEYVSVAGFLARAGRLCDDPAGAMYHALWWHLISVDMDRPIRMQTRLDATCARRAPWRASAAEVLRA